MDAELSFLNYFIIMHMYFLSYRKKNTYAL